jgi:hypothetical protein
MRLWCPEFTYSSYRKKNLARNYPITWETINISKETMESGLFGVTGLKGGTSTNNWNRDSDFLHRDVSPACTPSQNASERRSDVAKPSRPLPAMPPEQLKSLVSALSTPELLQVSFHKIFLRLVLLWWNF